MSNIDSWDTVKTVCVVLFGIETRHCIQKAFDENKWILQLTSYDIIDNLIQYHENEENIALILSKSIRNNEKVKLMWNENILYQLLLTVFKDNQTNISYILQEFVIITSNHALNSKSIKFDDCHLYQMIFLLISEMFDVCSINLRPNVQNKMIQYFVDRNMNGKRLLDMKQEVFVNNLASLVPKEVLQLLYHKLTSYKNQSIFQCNACYGIHIYGAKCKDNASKSESTECKTNATTLSNQDLGTQILELFVARSGKALDDKVFPQLMELLEHHKEGLIYIQHENYCTRLEDKDYDMILKSFIAFIVTIRCDNVDCDNIKSKLYCSCDNKFKQFTYALILSVNGLKSANNGSLLNKLANDERFILQITTLFCNILPDSLTEDKNAFKQYETHIKQWICFQLYDFKCMHCGHINKSILVDRMFKYAIHLDYCRLCHFKRGSKDGTAVDFDHCDKITATPKETIASYCRKLKQRTSDDFAQYKSGISMRYTVLRPKYGSLAEELRLNAIRCISKEKWDKYLKEAISLHTKLEKDPNNTAFSSVSNEYYGIHKQQMIGVCHLVVVLIYTQDIYFASAFSRAYWCWQNVNLFCDNFYWFGRYLYEAVHFYGVSFDHKRFKIKPLHHGLINRMLFDSFAPNIHFPAATNDVQHTAFTKAGRDGSVLSYVAKYVGDIEDTKCVSTAQWSGFDNNEWLFMGLSKLQIASIKCRDSDNKVNDYTLYNHAMLYLEKVFTQTVFDQHHYNTMNNALYLPKTREIALQLILRAVDKDKDSTNLPLYINTIFNHWRDNKRFITLETYPTESQFMSNDFKSFLIDSGTQRVHIINIRKLFPYLASYRDVDKKVVRRGDNTPSLERTFSTVTPLTPKVKSHEPNYNHSSSIQEVNCWKCKYCDYNNVALMVNSLWRYYNKSSACGLCGTHRFIELYDAKDAAPNNLNHNPFEEKLDIQGLATKQDKVEHGFDEDAQCLVGISHIVHLSSPQFTHLLEHHIIDSITHKKKKKVIYENKEKIIKYFKDKTINGAMFNELVKTRKDLTNNIIAYCDNNRKLNGALNTFFQAIKQFDLKTLGINKEKADHHVTFTLLLKHCPAMKRCTFIVQYFEKLTANINLEPGGRYPHDIRRILVSLPNYDPVQLWNDIEHIMDHTPSDSMRCEAKESDECIHFTRSRRDENDHRFIDIELKRKLFSCNNGHDFKYIDMLDRLHCTLKHAKDINHNTERNIKLIKDDMRSTKENFSVGVFMEYHSLDPLYYNLYREVTHNQSYSIPSHEFKSNISAVREFMQTNSKILACRAWKTDKKYGIQKGELIRVEHILCIKLYCNLSALCTAFRASYRKINYEDTDSVIIERHIADFYWLGRFLTNAVEFYGKAATTKLKIYTGIADRCLFEHFSAVYEMPTSTTWDREIANKFRKENGIILELSPKFKDQSYASRYIDVSMLSYFTEEKERLFAGMNVMAIVNIYAASCGKIMQYGEYIECILYLERIIEQNIHTRNQYNHSVITDKNIQDWKKRQRKYLVPLLQHQMHRNLVQYKKNINTLNNNVPQATRSLFKNIKPANAISLYVRELFEHFCDSKSRKHIDLSCINCERNTMDSSLRNLFFEYESNKINTIHISAIFPNVKEFKNSCGEWIRLQSLNASFKETELQNTVTVKTFTPSLESVLTENEGIMDAIDRWLGIYYKAHDRNDYYQDGVGKFRYFCEQEGLEDDDIEMELNEDPVNCSLTQFDDKFPLDTEISEEDKQSAFILSIIREYREPNPLIDSLKDAPHSQWSVTKSFFDISNINMNDLKQLYKKQCPSLWNAGLRSDETMMKVFAIGYKHQIPYLEYLVDVFIRDKVTDFELTPYKWAENNPYMQSVARLSSDYYSILLSAINTFCSSRVMPSINLYPQYLIRRSFKATAWDLYHMFCSVHCIADGGYTRSAYPFLSEFIILFDDVVQLQIHSDDITFDDDDDDDDDITLFDEIDEKIANIDDMNEALRIHKLDHYSTQLSFEETKGNKSRIFETCFRNFRSLKQDELDDDICKYPHRKRYCTVLDTRGANEEIHYFLPPSQCSNIPKDGVPEWYFDSTKQYLLPTNRKNNTITTQTNCGGKKMLFSVHVLSEDETKVYMYYNGGMMRFFGEDIVNVLPLFFDKEYCTEYINSYSGQKELKFMVKEFPFRDAKFKSFLRFATNT